MSKVASRPVGRPRADGKPPLERHQVLMTSGRLITEHGYAGTSLRMIADALGTSAPAIAQRFGSKAELLNELVTSMANVSIHFHKSLQSLGLAPDVRLYKMVFEEVFALSSAGAAPIGVFYLPELRQAAFEPAQQSRAKMMHFYFNAIHDGIESGLFQSPSAEISAEQVFQLTETIIIAQNRSEMGKPVELAKQTASFVLRGLSAKPFNAEKVQKAAEKIEISMT